MRLRLPGHYTILIARTGQEPIVLSVQKRPLIAALVAAVGLPIVGIGWLLHHNSQLAQQNEALSDTATEVIYELDTLDAEVDALKERAGLSESVGAPSESATDLPQGGVAEAIPPEELFSLAQERMPALNSTLKGQVKPALEETLADEAERKAAFPDGLPLKGELTVSSEFGLRSNPFGGRGFEMHAGIDFKGPIGTPIYATADGKVRRAENSGGYGNHVILDHGYGYETLYAHMTEMAVEVGQSVQRGQIVGYLGNTGRSSGPHLHYGVYRQGNPINPRYYLPLEPKS